MRGVGEGVRAVGGRPLIPDFLIRRQRARETAEWLHVHRFQHAATSVLCYLQKLLDAMPIKKNS